MKDRIVNRMLKKHLVDFSIIIFIFLIDRVSKLLIINSPETYEQYGISVTSFLNFNLIWNEGIAFGLFSFDEKLYYNFLDKIPLKQFIQPKLFHFYLEVY